jgi:hypothetical protein
MLQPLFMAIHIVIRPMLALRSTSDSLVVGGGEMMA